MIDVARVRAETPGCRTVIHFNNAGAALQPQPVLDAVLGHLKLEAEIGGYEAADRAEAALEGVYGSLARLINAAPDEIDRAHRERDPRLGHGLLFAEARAPATAS